MPFRMLKHLEFTPYVKVVRYKDIRKLGDGIYYVVGDNNTEDQCTAFETYINSTGDPILKFDIEPLDAKTANKVILDFNGFNPVTGTKGDIVISSSWAVFDDIPPYISTMPRLRFKTMEHRVFNVERISLLLSVLPYVIELDRYLSRELNAFKASPLRYRQGLIASYIASLPTFATQMTYTGNVIRFSNRKMYDVLMDLSNQNNNTSLFHRLLVYTEGN